MAEPIHDERLLTFLQRVAAGHQAFLKPDNVDLNTLPAEQSLMYGLPPRPIERTRSLELWQDLAASRTVPGTESVMLLAPDRPGTAYNRLGLKGHMETSRNWSGAVIASPYRSQGFDCLIGIWTIPDFRKPSHGTRDKYACSTWIGFDGHRRNSGSLPQIGTVQQITKDNSNNYHSSIVAWRQWWYPGDLTGPIEYDPTAFPISVGHQILASLFVIPGIGVLMNMLNVSTRQPIEARLVPVPRPDLEPRSLDAECVLERPKSLTTFANFMPPDFDPATFECHASLRGETKFRTMRGARLIRMVHQRRGKPIETIASPISSSSRELVTVRYGLR